MGRVAASISHAPIKGRCVRACATEVGVCVGFRGFVSSILTQWCYQKLIWSTFEEIRNLNMVVKVRFDQIEIRLDQIVVDFYGSSGWWCWWTITVMIEID